MYVHVHAHVHVRVCVHVHVHVHVHVRVCVGASSPRLQPEKSSEVSAETATARARGATAAPRRVQVSARPPSSSCRERSDATWCIGLQVEWKGLQVGMAIKVRVRAGAETAKSDRPAGAQSCSSRLRSASLCSSAETSATPPLSPSWQCASLSSLVPSARST